MAGNYDNQTDSARNYGGNYPSGGTVPMTLGGAIQGTITQGNVARSQPASERAHDDVQGAVARVHKAIESVRNFTTRQLGERCETSDKLKDQPGRSGAMGALQDRIDQLNASLSTLESELDRLNHI